MAKRVILFLLTNLAITFVLGIVLNIIFKVTGIQGGSTAGILVMSMLFGFAGSLISLFMSKSMALRSVGAEVITQPRSGAEQWLFDTVKRQSQQANIPMPDIAIYHSADVNAFATGATKSNSLVAVSTGLLDNMTHDEAEAVVAHEIDTFVIFLSRMISTAVASTKDENGNSSTNTLVFWVVDLLLQMVFGVLATMIAMWFSRYREFRADAGSAQLVGKEKMIAALQRLQSVHEPQAMEGSLAAFMINAPAKELFMSHPPLEKRIEALRNL